MLGFHNVVVSCNDGVASLRGFSYKRMYGHFARTKNSAHNNEVVILILFNEVPLY